MQKKEWPNYSKNLILEINKILNSGIVNYTIGNYGEKFEKSFSVYTGIANCTSCSNGTTALQLALLAAGLGPGDEIICHQHSHIYLYEAGAWAAISGCSVRLLEGDRGQFGAEDVANAIQMDDHHFPCSRLLSIENTHNRDGGTVFFRWALRDADFLTTLFVCTLRFCPL